jgi:hypothetical protein
MHALRLIGWCCCTLPMLAACDPPPAPVVSASPARILRVHGDADPTLTIRVSTRHISTGEECARKAGGAAVPRAREVESSVTRSDTGYEATVVLDHFVADACRWHPFLISFQVTNRAGLSTGHFATGPQGTTHTPGLEAKVWISAPEGSRSATDREARHGSAYMRPLELQCTKNVMGGVSGLSCVPDSPRELPLISTEAADVQVDFHDLTGK